MYQVKPTSFKGNHALLKYDQHFSEICYQGWSLDQAQASYQGQNIEIQTSSKQKESHEIIKNGIKIGQITLGCQMWPCIEVLDQNQVTQHFVLQSEGFWNYKYVLHFANPKTPAIVLQPKVNWKKLTTHYDVKVVSATPLHFEVPALVIYSIYAMNMLASTM
ncbi:MAG TPA: hypothetical protein DCS93_36985 [Microscillaceae bacterium]|nr:hypothetical protein [Microscillaceae bacterium]